MSLPRHIAIIPDGNRRWAKERGLPSFFGHREGARTTEKTLLKALELKIPYLTFWGCSINNVLKRDALEVKFLMELFANEFSALADSKIIHENGIRIRVLGRWGEYFTSNAKESVEKMVEKTKTYTSFNLTFLLAYNGTEEMLSAVKEIASSKSNPEGISEEIIKDHLYTRDLPPVDLVIRTGNDAHLSTGFMMWDTADAELYFSPHFWPDFSPEELEKVVTNFDQTERRLGK